MANNSETHHVPKVGILVGSASDLPVMEKAAEVLEELGISHEMDICSAHRLPDKTSAYARSARERGIAVIIAGAGMAAHLAGVIASHTTLPVIGVPISSGAFRGIDALLSTVQMPPGIPVATVAVDGAKNAAFLAASILSLSHADIEMSLAQYREKTREEIEKVSASIKNHSETVPGKRENSQ